MVPCVQPDPRWGQHGPCDGSAQATVLPTDNIKQVSTKTSYPAQELVLRCLSRLWSQALNPYVNFLSATVMLRLFRIQQRQKKFSTSI